MSLEENFISSQPQASMEKSGTDALRSSKIPMTLQYLLCLLMAAMATSIAAGFERYETIPNLSLIYVVPVVIASVAFGLAPALFSSILGALAYNFFFAPPRFSLAVADPANIWAIALLFVIGCITSAVAWMGRRKGIDLEQHLRVEEALGTYARRMTGARSIEEATKLTVTTLTALFQSPATVIFTGKNFDVLSIEGEKSLTPTEIEAAQSSWASNSVVTAGIYPFDESRFDFWPVTTKLDRQVTVGVAFAPGQRPSNFATLIEIVSLLFGATIDRCGV